MGLGKRHFPRDKWDQKEYELGKRCAPRDGHCLSKLYGFLVGRWSQGSGFKGKSCFGEKMGTWVKLKRGWA
jgi:hypothetical protein